MVGEFDGICNDKNIVVTFTHSIKKISMNCDKDKIKQVLRHLLSNAIKFTTDKISINVNIKASNKFVSISVTDSGPGIPISEIEVIFEKFIQSSSIRTGTGGAGLGLSISKEIVLLHRGRIWAENIEGIGAKICFEIPMEKNCES